MAKPYRLSLNLIILSIIVSIFSLSRNLVLVAVSFLLASLFLDFITTISYKLKSDKNLMFFYSFASIEWDDNILKR